MTLIYTVCSMFFLFPYLYAATFFVLYPHDPCSLYIWKAWGVLVTPLSRNCCLV